MASGNLKYFNGKVANVIGYQSLGKQRLRSMPARVRQTKATKQSGLLFGKASSIAAAIRYNLVSINPYPSDLKMQTRLTSSIYKWLKENAGKTPFTANHLPFIESYQFVDEGYTLADRMRITIEVRQIAEDRLQIDIPAFIPRQSIIAPAHTESLDFHFTAVHCPLNRPEDALSASTVFNLEYSEQPIDGHRFLLELPTRPESLLVTVLALRYLTPGGKTVQSSIEKGFRPTAIISAMNL